MEALLSFLILDPSAKKDRGRLTSHPSPQTIASILLPPSPVPGTGTIHFLTKSRTASGVVGSGSQLSSPVVGPALEADNLIVWRIVKRYSGSGDGIGGR